MKVSELEIESSNVIGDISVHDYILYSCVKFCHDSNSNNWLINYNIDFKNNSICVSPKLKEITDHTKRYWLNLWELVDADVVTLRNIIGSLDNFMERNREN